LLDSIEKTSENDEKCDDDKVGACEKGVWVPGGIIVSLSLSRYSGQP
jgi:hypothetical protein